MVFDSVGSSYFAVDGLRCPLAMFLFEVWLSGCQSWSYLSNGGGHDEYRTVETMKTEEWRWREKKRRKKVRKKERKKKKIGRV